MPVETGQIPLPAVAAVEGLSVVQPFASGMLVPAGRGRVGLSKERSGVVVLRLGQMAADKTQEYCGVELPG